MSSGRYCWKFSTKRILIVVPSPKHSPNLLYAFGRFIGSVGIFIIWFPSEINVRCIFIKLRKGKVCPISIHRNKTMYIIHVEHWLVSHLFECYKYDIATNSTHTRQSFIIETVVGMSYVGFHFCPDSFQCLSGFSGIHVMIQ